MNDIDNDVVKKASGAGYFLKEEYKKHNSESRLNNIIYRLLNAMKANDKNAFIHIVIICYMFVKTKIPKIIVNGLNDDSFKVVGYSFITGLIDDKNDNAEVVENDK